MAVAVLVHRAPIRLAQQIAQSWQLLSDLGEWDAIMPAADADPSSSEELLRELESLDDGALASS